MRIKDYGKLYIHVVRHLHLVLLLALAVPFIEIFDASQTDAVMMRLYAASLAVMIPAGFLYTVAERAGSAMRYLPAACGLIAGTAVASHVFSSAVFAGYAPAALTIVNTAWTVLYSADAFRTRLNENARARAAQQNDPDWREADLLPGPSVVVLLLFALLYVAALYTHNDGLCDCVMAGTIFYFFLFVFYEYLSGRESYLGALEDIRGIPVNRIRKTGLACLVAFLVPAAAAAVFTVVFGKFRQYLTMPEVSFEMETGGEEWGSSPEMMDPSAFSEFLGTEASDPPVWLTVLERYASVILTTVVLAAVAVLAARAIIRILQAFGDRVPENNDVIQKVEPEDHVTALRTINGRKSFLSNRIRRKYRRVILRYRKEKPGNAETPSEIEANTTVPDREALRRLHEEYEKTRYG